MDVEGYEYENILYCPHTTLERFRIICVELHNLQELRYPREQIGKLISRTLLKLGETHVCVYIHANNVVTECRLPGTNVMLPPLMECTFIRRDRLKHYPYSSPLQLPQSLDILNMPVNPPTILDRFFTAPLVTALCNPLLLLLTACDLPTSI